MLDELANVGWHLEVQPGWNAEDEVRQAIRALSSASSESGDSAYSRMLYAIGNNHAGTYFPVVLAVIPFLGEILRDEGSSSAARARTLDVLIDLVGSFEPEPGFELVATPAGARPLKDVLKEKIVELETDVERLLAKRTSPEDVRIAKELLALLRE